MNNQAQHEFDRAGAEFADLLAELPPPLIDGYLVHCALLRYGFDILLLPRQVLLASPAGRDPGDLAFVHGVPNSSTLSAVTYAQDRRIRRALLQRAGLPVPRGATFSFKGMADACRYAERIGYPVVLKEAVSQGVGEQERIANNAKELRKAIREMRAISPDAESSAASITRSAYALTGLLPSEESEDGAELRAVQTRFLVEKVHTGQYLRFLVRGDRVLAAAHRSPKGDDFAFIHIHDNMHPDWSKIAVSSVAAMGGLAVASIDVLMQDFSKAPTEQVYYIVELSERPRLDSYQSSDAFLGLVYASEVVSAEVEEGGPAASLLTNISVRFKWENLSNAEAVLTELHERVNALNIVVSAEIIDAVEGIVIGTVSGSPESVAFVNELVLNGLMGNSRAMAVEAMQCSLDLKNPLITPLGSGFDNTRLSK